MMFPFMLSKVTEFAYYNFVFDGIILFFTIIYFIAGFKRGMKRTLWYVVFDVISIAATYCLCRFVCPLFIDKIPKVGLSLFPIGIRLVVDSLYSLILTILIGIIAFLIIRFGIFKKILTIFKDNDYNYRRHKNIFGRVVATILTAGLAFTLSSGAIVATKKMTGSSLFRYYDNEMSETYVAKYGDKYIVKLVRKLIATDSIENPHDTVVKKVTNGKYTFSDVPYYREGIQRLVAVNNPEGYLNAIVASEDAGLIRFNQDLHVWILLAEQSKNYSLLDEMVSPLVKKANELNYKFSGDTNELFDIKPYQSYFSTSTYEGLVNIYYPVVSEETVSPAA